MNRRIELSTCPELVTIGHFCAGKLRGGELAAIEGHVSHCDRCLQVVGDYDAEQGAVESADAFSAVRERALEVGATVGRYVILSELGSGATGIVYVAWDPSLGRRVALKLLASTTDVLDQATRQQRLIREAQALARVRHRNVVTVYDAGGIETRVFIAMELVQGVTLRQWALEGRSWREIVRVFVAAGQGLAAAHRAGIVHRDFKPDNVLVGVGGAVAVIDFGLATDTSSSASASKPEAGPWSASSGSGRLTLTGATIGSPAYMAPAQLSGAPADARSDQFSFCIALHEVLYGSRPPRDGTGDGTGGQHTGSGAIGSDTGARAGPQQLAPAGRRAVPAWLRRTVHRGLFTQPQQRWKDMDALVAALRAGAGRRRRFVAGAFAVAAVVGLGVGMWTWRSTPPVALCTSGPNEIATVWSRARRDMVRETMLATGVPYAEHTAARIVPLVDAYTEQWAQMHVDACEATAVRGEQSAEVLDLRMVCLNHAKVALGAAVNLWESADAKTVERAETVVSGLPELRACADIEALRAEVSPPPPRLEAAVSRVRSLLADARASRLAGHLERASSSIDRAADQAEAIQYAPLQTELSLAIGLQHSAEGTFAKAASALREALRQGLAVGSRGVAQEAAVALVNVVGVQRREHAMGLAYATTAQGLVAKGNGASTVLVSRLHIYLGDMHAQVANFDEALIHQKKALALRQSIEPTNDLAIVLSHRAMGMLAYDTGNYREAEQTIEMALERATSALGESHPTRASLLDDLSVVVGAQGRYREAIAMGNAALSLASNDHHRAVFHHNLSDAYRRTEDYVRSETHLRAALALAERAQPHDAYFASVFAVSLAEMQHSQGRTQEAVAVLGAALTRLQAKAESSHDSLVALMHFNLAIYYAAQKRFDASETSVRASLSLDQTASAFRLLGELLDRVPRTRTEAVEALERAWELIDRPGSRLENRGIVARALAVALWRKGDRLRARALMLDARDSFARSESAMAATAVPRVEAWLRRHR